MNRIRANLTNSRWTLVGVFIALLGACDANDLSQRGSKVEDNETLKAFLELPLTTSTSGAHRQDDPHAQLSATQMAQVALQHLDESRSGLALSTLNSAMQKFPQNAMLLSLRASLYLQRTQPGLALTDLNNAIAIEPHDPILLTNRAQALRRFGRAREAQSDLDQAIKLDPDFVAALFNRGSLAFEAGNFERALDDFNRCVEIDPKVAAGYFNRAATLAAIGEHASAIADLQHFLKLAPAANWASLAQDLLAKWEAEQS